MNWILIQTHVNVCISFCAPKSTLDIKNSIGSETLPHLGFLGTTLVSKLGNLANGGSKSPLLADNPLTFATQPCGNLVWNLCVGLSFPLTEAATGLREVNMAWPRPLFGLKLIHLSHVLFLLNVIGWFISEVFPPSPVENLVSSF